MRKASEEWDVAAILSFKVSPENLRRGSRTVVKAGNLLPVDSQLRAGRPHDKDADEMRKYAEQHPEKDQELETGGVSESQQRRELEQGTDGKTLYYRRKAI